MAVLVGWLRAPAVERVLRVFMETQVELHGWDVITYLAGVGGVFLLALYLVTLPLRLLVRRRSPPSFRRSALALLAFSFALWVLLALALRHAPYAQEPAKYWEQARTYATILATIYPFALIFVAISVRIRKTMAVLEARTEPPPAGARF
jgi:hypothetical protein